MREIDSIKRCASGKIISTAFSPVKKKKPGVIVLGGHVQGLGICRIFGKLGIPSIVIDETKFNIARHSKYCSRFFNLQLAEILPNFLSDIFCKEFSDWLIMPTNDYHVKLISENKTNLSNHYEVGVESWDKVKLFYNKTESYPLVEKLKIPCPKTFVVSNQKDLNELSKTVEYPVIIKPSVMMDFYRQFRKKVIQCNCPEELINNYKTAVSRINARDILVQEVIPGSSDNLYSVGVNMHNGNSINAIVVRRSRQHPIMYGNATTYAETVDLPELLEYAKKLLNYVDYSGLAEVEFKYDKRDGKYKFLEVNPRTWKWHIITQKANIPLLENYYNIQFGLPVVEEKTVQASWRHDLLDQIVKLGMRYKHLPTKPQKYEKISAVWSSADFWPGVFEYLYLPYNLINRR